ncbi:hypothetical protein AC477_01380 [miscellaneous Crenarchaeota group-1 archaeon SG8-32-1]|uniref:Uncharacterized protein n=1 Tax=miscellaneous Crenarchaeota group-1 archaeon SG8-32-1 TaxID=1685124 RepID=A0A0M0BZK9_9ARCH|nr:MAG: hypothetical protein AC477_01380 [miscellaneous Crenarchaeota group-1 archaeon SG8-32-1]
MNLWARFFMFSILSSSIFAFSFTTIWASDSEDATVVISNAEAFLSGTFEAILEAEQAGANVSLFLSRLNLGGEYLNEANVLYSAGAYDDSILFANLCIETVNDIRTESIELVGKVETDFSSKLFWSIFGVLIVGIAGFVTWLFFKRNYLERV